MDQGGNYWTLFTPGIWKVLHAVLHTRAYLRTAPAVSAMSDTLVTYPILVVRIACRNCRWRGSYRLARLVAKYGAEIEMMDLLARLAGDCAAWIPHHPVQMKCGAFFLDLGWPPRPPDLPTMGERRRLLLIGDDKSAA
jgi:hypothetical protein